MDGTDTHTRVSRRRILQLTGTGLVAGTAGCIQSTLGSADPLEYGDRSPQTTKKYKNEYNKAHDHEFTYVLIGQDYHDALLKIKAANADNLPEVMGIDISSFANVADLGGLKAQDSFIPTLPYYDDFVGRLDPLFTTYNGTFYGVPFWVDSSLYFYNKKHFKQAGLDPEDPPSTWTAFKDAAKALQGINEKFPPVGMVLDSGFFFLPWAWSNGGGILDDDGTVILDEKETVEALEYWVEFNSEEQLTTDLVAAKFSNWHNMFVDEKLSIIFSGGSGIGKVRENNEELFNNYLGNALFPKPSGGTHSSYLGGNNLCISPGANDDELARAQNFMKWINTEEGMKVTLEQGYMPGRNKGFEVGLAAEEPYNTLLKSFQEALKVGGSPIHPQFTMFQNEYSAALSAALGGVVSPQQALTTAANNIRNGLEESS